MFFNSRALAELGFDREAFDAHPQASWEEGHLWERGALALGGPMVRVLAAPARYRAGLSMMSEVLHRGGLTTVAEERKSNLHVHEGVSEAEFVKMRKERDATLAVPALILPSVQVNMRAGQLPPEEDNGSRYLKIPVDAI